jgi:serpin B
MPLAFVPKADFSGMNGGKEPLFIDSVLHKAVLVVDEKGAEAAAATAIMMRTLSVRIDPPKEFLVDQPFLVAITDKTTKGILFLGRVATPKAK